MNIERNFRHGEGENRPSHKILRSNRCHASREDAHGEAFERLREPAAQGPWGGGLPGGGAAREEAGTGQVPADSAEALLREEGRPHRAQSWEASAQGAW